MRKLFISIILCIAFSSIYSDEVRNSVAPVNVMESGPDSIVNGSVSVISGDYVESENDLIVPGIEPIVINRMHTSNNDGDSSFLGPGWSNIHYQTFYSSAEWWDRQALLTESSGTVVFWKMADDLRRMTPDVTGITNCSFGELSGRTNVKNTVFSFNSRENDLVVKTGAGGERKFSKLWWKADRHSGKKYIAYEYTGDYYIKVEKKPNGNRIIYEYDEKRRLSFIKTTNALGSKTFNSVKFSYEDKPEFRGHTIEGSNGKNVKYERNIDAEQGNTFYLNSVYRSDDVDVNYGYTQISFPGSNHKSITRCDMPDGRYLITDYYGAKLNLVGDEKLNLDYRSGDPRLGRVSTQWAPLGVDDTPVLAARYFYTVRRHKERKKVLVFDNGETSFYDALDNLTVYHYNKQKRITEVDAYSKNLSTGERDKYKVDRYIWGPETRRDASNLFARVVEDGTGKVVKCRTFLYDDRNNVLEEKLYGALTGRKPANIIIGDAGNVSGDSECYTRRYTYSDDGMNLMLSHTEDNGNIERFWYKPGTDLPTKKLVGKGSKIYSRSFIEYDEDTIPIRTVTDDGSAEDIGNMAGVTERKIVVVTPKEESPGLGLPEVVEERFFDMKTDTEVMTKRLVNTYNSNNLIIRSDVYDAMNELRYSTHIEYDEKGRPVKEIDPLGRVIKTAYDANGNKVYMSGPRTDSHAEYFYDFSNRLIREEEKHADGTTFSTGYRYDYGGNLLARTDIYGNETTYQYDDFGRAIAETGPEVIDEIGTRRSNTVRKEYDIFGNVTAVINEKGERTATLYNIRSQPVSIHYPDGTAEGFAYNMDGTLASKYNRNDSVTFYDYDIMGRVAYERTCFEYRGPLNRSTNTYDGFHLVLAADGKGFATQYEHDYAGRVVSVSKGESYTEYAYDSLGKLSSTKEFFGNGVKDYTETIVVYDVLDRTIEERVEDGSGAVLSQTNKEYDIAGNCTRVTTYCQKGASTTVSEYNSRNELSKTTDALGNVTMIHTNHGFRNDREQTVVQKTVSDPMGMQVVETCDAMGRVESVVKKNVVGTVLGKAECRYDATGNKTRAIETVFSGDKIIDTQTTAWEYGPASRLEAVYERFDLTASRITAYSYNTYGQLVAVVKPDGIDYHYEYDWLGRMSRFYASDGSFSYCYTYDNNNNMISVEDDIDGTATQRVYDSAGRIVKEFLGNDTWVKYSRDRQGRSTEVEFSCGREVKYSYDAARLRSVKYSRDGKEYEHRYEDFDQSGSVVEASLIGDGGTVHFEKDLLGRVTAITSKAWVETIDGYDPVGNITRSTVGGILHDYSYDALYQITEESGHEPHKYSYDSINNRRGKDCDAYDVGSYNELRSTGKAKYSYDPNGSLIEKVEDDKRVTYRYDAQDRLVEAVGEAAWKVLFVYDPFNRRISKEIFDWDGIGWMCSHKLRYLFAENNEVGILDEKGRVFEFRALGLGHGAEIGAAVAVDVGGTVYAPLHDHGGNVVALINANNGEVAERYLYTSFGEETITRGDGRRLEASAVGNPWRFSSKRVEDDLKMVFFGRRYYDPVVGRWTTTDPKGFVDGPNLYSYLHNGPLTHFDLYGEFSFRGAASKIGSAITSGFRRAGSAFSRGTSKAFGGAGRALDSVGRGVSFFAAPIGNVIRRAGRIIQGKNTSDIKVERSWSRTVGMVDIADLSLGIMYGINTPAALALSRTEAISEEYGGIKFDITHNPGKGVLVDISRVLLHEASTPTATVKRLVVDLRDSIERVGKDGTVVRFAFSHGGLILYRALKCLTPEERQMIEVHTFGSAKLIPNDMARKVVNFVGRYDPVPRLDPTFFMPNRDKHYNVVMLNKGSTFPFDHSWDSKVYQSAFRDVMRDKINERFRGMTR